MQRIIVLIFLCHFCLNSLWSKPNFPPGTGKGYQDQTSDFHVSMNWLGPWQFRPAQSGDWQTWKDPYSTALEENQKSWQWKRLVEIAPEAKNREWGIYFNHPISALEVWWDDLYLGSSGHPSTLAAEEQIESLRFFTIPSHYASSGKHVLTIYTSYHHQMLKPASPDLEIAPFTHLHQKVFRENIILVFLAGSFLLAAVLQLLLFPDSDTRTPNLVFSTSFLACAGYILISEYWTYTNVNPEIMMVILAGQYLTWAGMMIIPVWYWLPEMSSLTKRFNLTYSIMAALVILPLALWEYGVLPFSFGKGLTRANESLTYIMLGICFFHDFRSRKAGHTSNIAIFAGLLVLSAGVFLSWRFNSPYAWAVGLSVMITIIILVHAKRLALYKDTLEKARLRAARLELELLKKNIQPHFLLNSLSSIMAWMEEEPNNAKLLVEALGEELKLLLQISPLRTISIKKEIDLCKAHLKVMELRQDKKFTFKTEGIIEKFEIPPLVLHTLVENGLTHGYVGKNTGEFHLVMEKTLRGCRLSFFNDSNPKRKTKSAKGKPEGTGLRYIRFRLEEAFPGNWKLESRPLPTGWKVDINIFSGLQMQI